MKSEKESLIGEKGQYRTRLLSPGRRSGADTDEIGLKRSQISPGRLGQKKVYEEGLRRANPAVL